MAGEPVQHVKVVWTYDDYRLTPDDGQRYEVIDGDLVVTPAPTTTHQAVSKRIQFQLMLQIEARGRGVVFNAPVDVIFSKTQCVQPDLVVVASARTGIITPRGIEGAPDLVVEILSPSTDAIDRVRKMKLYVERGVREYWIVDATNHSVEVFEPGEDGYRTRSRFGPGDRLMSAVFELDIELDPLFAPATAMRL